MPPGLSRDAAPPRNRGTGQRRLGFACSRCTPFCGSSVIECLENRAWTGLSMPAARQQFRKRRSHRLKLSNLVLDDRDPLGGQSLDTLAWRRSVPEVKQHRDLIERKAQCLGMLHEADQPDTL